MLRILILSLLLASTVGCQSFKKESDNDRTSDVDPIRGSPRAIDPDSNSGATGIQTKSKSKPQLYKVTPSKPLELPPDLVESSNAKVLENDEIASQSDLRVLPEVLGARIINQDGNKWLEIDADAETAWKIMTEYWSLSGVNLVEYNPEAGIMETDWIEEVDAVDTEGSTITNSVKNLFNSFTKRKTSRNKYQIRFERISAKKTSMYVEHRWIARKSIEYSKKISEFEWVELPSDPDRVAEFLQNIVLVFDESAST